MICDIVNHICLATYIYKFISEVVIKKGERQLLKKKEKKKQVLYLYIYNQNKA